MRTAILKVLFHLSLEASLNHAWHSSSPLPRQQWRCLRSKSSFSSSTEEGPTTDPLACTHCGKTLPSRSQLFKHLRSDCPHVNDGAVLSIAATEAQQLRRRHFAVLVSYPRDSFAVEEAFRTVLDEERSAALKVSFSAKNYRLTRCTGTRHRGDESCLRHEPSLGAAADVLTLSTTCAGVHDWPARLSNLSDPSTMTVLAVEELSPDPRSGRVMHAEHSCRQRSYEYLVPLSWLRGAEGWKSDCSLGDGATAREGEERSGTAIDAFYGGATDEVREALRLFKVALRGCTRGSFLSAASPAAWHNFNGDRVSPFHAHAQNARIDFAKVVDVVFRREGVGRGEPQLVVELRAPFVLREQLRRVVASAVLVQRGSLPPDFFRRATSQRVVCDTPIAPPERLFFGSALFWPSRAYDHIAAGGGSTNTVGDSGDDNRRVGQLLQSKKQPFGQSGRALIAESKARMRVACTDAGASDAAGETSDAAWLEEQEKEVAPRVLRALEREEEAHVRRRRGGDDSDAPSSSSSISSSTTTPVAYQRVLQLLREAEERWPATSPNRAKLIGGGTSAEEAEGSSQEGGGGGDGGGGGSFTLANPSRPGGGIIPAANSLFPELAAAVFALEAAVSPNPRRPPSTRCAVNRRARFSPHRDSGRGKGQTLSMIAGLGSYGGGEIVVEGEATDCRYAPLEFDGWRERHWTRPFVGERFSLVWFSPADH